jgi:carbonic anhydrase
MTTARLPFAVALLVGVVLASGCSSGSSHASGSHAPHWSYTGTAGPRHWGSLSSDYATCSDGTRQSPIDITNPPVGTAPALVTHYRAGSAEVVNNGHSIQADAKPGSDVSLDGTTYALAQMHFHSPSETTLAGTHAPIELHFVNSNAGGKSVVIAAMVQPGRENVAWRSYVDALGLRKGDSTNIDVDWSKLLPTDLSAIRFMGSLTTPPCTEGLPWLVLTTPITMSPAQIKAFQRAYSGNNRPTQPLNGRTVVDDAAGPPDAR